MVRSSCARLLVLALFGAVLPSRGENAPTSAELVRAGETPDNRDSLRFAALMGAAIDSLRLPPGPKRDEAIVVLSLRRWAGWFENGVTAPVVAELEALPAPLAERVWQLETGSAVLELDGEELRIPLPDIRLNLIASLILEGRMAEARARFTVLAAAIDERAALLDQRDPHRITDSLLANVRELVELCLVRADQDPFPIFTHLIDLDHWGFDNVRRPVPRRLGAWLAEHGGYPEVARYLRAAVAKETRAALVRTDETLLAGGVPDSVLARFERERAELRQLEATPRAESTAGAATEAPLFYAPAGTVTPLEQAEEHEEARLCDHASGRGWRSMGSGWPEGLSLIDSACHAECELLALAFGPGAPAGEVAIWFLMSQDGGKTWPLRAHTGMYVPADVEICTPVNANSSDRGVAVFPLGLRRTPVRPFERDETKLPALTWAELRLDLAELGRDGDGDGWSDVLEHHLGTDVASADSDADGVLDAADPFPLLAVPNADAASPASGALAAALMAWGGELQDGEIFPPYSDQWQEQHLAELAPGSRLFIVEGKDVPITSLSAPGWAVIAREASANPTGNDTPVAATARIELFVLDHGEERAIVIANDRRTRRHTLVERVDGQWRSAGSRVWHCGYQGRCP